MIHSEKYSPELAKYCDHTVLKAFTKTEVVKAFCDEAKQYSLASVCVNPVHVAFVRKQLENSDVRTCCVIGFPLGATLPDVKGYEARRAVEEGAQELDMVLNVGAMRDGNDALVLEDIKAVVAAAQGKATVKVILETCYLAKAEIARACSLATEAGADYVKTSSGFGTSGAMEEDIRLMRQSIAPHMKVKASTGILTQEDARRMIAAGAERLGLSTSIQVIEGDSTIITASASNKIGG